MLPKARIVAAFHTVPSDVLFDVYEARRKAGRPSLVYCGDDNSAKAAAAELIRDVGFDPLDTGPMLTARYQRAVRSARCPTRVRGGSGPGAGLSVRAVREIGRTELAL